MNTVLKVMMLVIIVMITTLQAIAQPSKVDYYQAKNDAETLGITEQKAIAIAQQNFSGHVLAINHLENIFRVKMLSRHGTVHIIIINAIDGEIISTH